MDKKNETNKQIERERKKQRTWTNSKQADKLELKLELSQWRLTASPSYIFEIQ